MTDMEMVGREGMGETRKGWDSLKVHKAVVLSLCPFLANILKGT